jgi:hypothetical protein
MRNDVSLFIELYNLEKPKELALGDGHVVKATGRGVVVIEIQSSNSPKTKRCVLQDVLYVPNLSHSLLSVSKAIKSGKTVYSLMKMDVIFFMQVKRKLQKRYKRHIWTPIENLVYGFDYDKSKYIDLCESCVDGKHRRSKFPVNGGERAKEPLDLVYSVVCGKMNPKSLGGAVINIY